MPKTRRRGFTLVELPAVSRRQREAFTLVELPAVSRRQRAAFTLVELLVVVGIIVVLVAILLPVLGAARERAAATQCASNIRQVILAMSMYEADHGSYPIAHDKCYGTAP